jgi:hypothetical protein
MASISVRPSFFRRHPIVAWFAGMLLLCVTGFGALALKHRHAEAQANRACAMARPGASLSSFRAALREQGIDYRAFNEGPGKPVVIAHFPALFDESFVCMVDGHGDEISRVEISLQN